MPLYAQTAEGGTPSHSPFLHFAKLLRRQLGVPIGLIPTALGGSGIVAWLRGTQHVLFANMAAYCRDAGAARVRGVLWYQGESDASPEAAPLYAARFRELVAAWREHFAAPDLPVLTAQLNRYTFPKPGDPMHAPWDLVRETQRALARELPNVYVVSTLDLGLSDDIHNASAGNLVLGERFAACALGGVFGLPVKFRHPELAAATATGPAQVELRFDHVDSHLILYALPDPNQLFAVRDEGGANAVTSIAANGPRALRLELARPLQGAATVTGGPGTNPTTLIPADFVGFRPLLAFTAAVQR